MSWWRRRHRLCYRLDLERTDYLLLAIAAGSIAGILRVRGAA